LAAQLYEASGSLNWLDLTARYRWIAQHSAEIAYQADLRMARELAEKLWLRAARYHALGQHFAADLGVPWDAIEMPLLPDWMVQEAEASYQQLRRLYNRANQPIISGLADQRVNVTGRVSGVIESITDGAHAFGVRAADVTLDANRGLAQAGDSTFRGAWELALQVERIAGGTCTLLDIQQLHSTAQLLPILLRVEGALQVEQAADATIVGFLVHQLSGSPFGWEVEMKMQIGQFADTRLIGVVVRPARGERKSAGPHTTESVPTTAASQ
jgi:hypothetical protein